MNSKKWIKIFSILTFSTIVLVGLTNYIIDPFKIFNSDLLPKEFQHNERFNKIEILDKSDFDTLLFGSSRIGTTDPRIVQKYLPTSKVYNFTLSSANISDYLINLEYIIRKRYLIKNLFIQIDLDNMNYFGFNDSDYLRKLHPNVIDSYIIEFYFEYLFNIFPINYLEKIKENIYNENTKVYSYKTGYWYDPKKDSLLKENCNKFIDNESTFRENKQKEYKYTKKIENLESLKKIVNLSKKHNIKLYIYTTAHNQNMLDKFYMEDYFEFLRDLSKTTDFYDFSGFNSITTNNCNYYEYSHYIPKIAEFIYARMFKDKNENVPNDFGYLVTLNNIEERIYQLKKEFLKRK